MSSRAGKSIYKPLRLSVAIDTIQFDPHDEQTSKFDQDSTVYLIYKDLNHQATLVPGQVSNCQVVLDSTFLANDLSVIRVISKDERLCLNQKAHKDANEDLDARVGTISLNINYFRDLNPSLYGKPLTQWITLFDDVQDDEFDGELNEDDEELPMVRVTFQVDVEPEKPIQQPKTAQQMWQKSAEPKAQDQITKNVQQTISEPKKAASDNKSSSRATNLAKAGSRGALASPPRVSQQTVQKRKTVANVNTEKLNQPEQSPRDNGSPGTAVGSALLSNRRAKQQQKVNDVFGDFFGFGPNPPGCMSKGSEPIDIKKEKEKFLALLTQEAKRYDIQKMHAELDQKIENIVSGIKKEEKAIMNDEERQLRNLDRLNYMTEYLKEDHSRTQASLLSAQSIRDKSKQEMDSFEKANQLELNSLEKQVKQMQALIEQAQMEGEKVKNEKQKLLKKLQENQLMSP